MDILNFRVAPTLAVLGLFFKIEKLSAYPTFLHGFIAHVIWHVPKDNQKRPFLTYTGKKFGTAKTNCFKNRRRQLEIGKILYLQLKIFFLILPFKTIKKCNKKIIYSFAEAVYIVPKAFCEILATWDDTFTRTKTRLYQKFCRERKNFPQKVGSPVDILSDTGSAD